MAERKTPNLGRCSFLSHFVLTKIRTSATVDILFLALGPYIPDSKNNTKNNDDYNKNHHFTSCQRSKMSFFDTAVCAVVK